MAGVLSCMALPLVAAEADGGNALRLHYDRPADYFEEALVIGNGMLGAVLYGGTSSEHISLNDLTLWTGEPEGAATSPDAYKAIPAIRAALDREDYREADRLQRQVEGHYSENYQPLGTLTIDYEGGSDEAARVEHYGRWLDLNDAVAATRYELGGSRFSTDYFASAPDSVIVLRLKAEGGKGIEARLRFSSLLPYTCRATGNEIAAEGYAAYHSYPNYYGDVQNKHLYDPARGTRFKTLIRVLPKDGSVESFSTGDLKLSGCHEAVILIANVTSFNGFDRNPATEGRDYRTLVTRRMEHAAAKSYDDLLAAHKADYQRLFARVSLDLGQTAPEIAALPTDRQLLLYADSAQYNPDLEELYFQYGRYLLIASSRTPGVPANLQGLWNESLLPPWSSNYTTNINLEENYWPAGPLNLIELQQPLIDFIENLAQTGRTTAQAYYGVSTGWCLGHNSDIWATTNPVGLHTGDPVWACWNMGGAWLSTHIWEHYLFTQDKDFLSKHYDALKGAADFCLNWLVEKDGWLMTSPSTSPENLYRTPDGYVGATLYGGTGDLAFIRECLTDAAKAAEVLGKDKDFRRQVERTLKRLAPYKIGKDGNLQEWYHDWADQDPHHRHQTHLFGLYPGHHLSPEETPELAKACARTLEVKGYETTGWSAGWRINLYARLLDGAKAYRMYRRLLRYVSPDAYQGRDARRGGGTYPNLLDAHSPFQIDGNFGGCAGVGEMLLQSSEKDITLLPALPEAWSRSGRVNGLCARGGFVVDMAWQDGCITSLVLRSARGGKTTVRFNGTTRTVRLKAGEQKTLL